MPPYGTPVERHSLIRLAAMNAQQHPVCRELNTGVPARPPQYFICHNQGHGWHETPEEDAEEGEGAPREGDPVSARTCLPPKEMPHQPRNTCCLPWMCPSAKEVPKPQNVSLDSSLIPPLLPLQRSHRIHSSPRRSPFAAEARTILGNHRRKRGKSTSTGGRRLTLQSGSRSTPTFMTSPIVTSRIGRRKGEPSRTRQGKWDRPPRGCSVGCRQRGHSLARCPNVCTRVVLGGSPSCRRRSCVCSCFASWNHTYFGTGNP